MGKNIVGQHALNCSVGTINKNTEGTGKGKAKVNKHILNKTGKIKMVPAELMVQAQYGRCVNE